MLGLSRLAGGGLLLLLVLALLPLALDGKRAPLPQALPKAPAGGTTAQQQQAAAEESSGPEAGRSGSKAGNAAPTPPKKGRTSNSCFGVRLDRIGTQSGLGCRRSGS